MKNLLSLLQFTALCLVQVVMAAAPQAASSSSADWVPQVAAPGTNWLAFSDDSRFVIGGGGEMVRVWNARDGALERQVPAASAEVEAVGVAHWNRGGVAPLISGQWKSELARRDARLRQWLRVLPQSALPGFGTVTCFQLSPDGRILAAGSDGGLVRLWDVKASRILKSLPAYPPPPPDDPRFPSRRRPQITSLTFSRDGRYLAASGEGTQVWHLSSGRRVAKVVGMIPGGMLRMKFSPDGLYLAGCWHYGNVVIFRVRDGRLVRQLYCEQDDGTMFDFAFSPDGRLLTTVGNWSVSMSEPRQVWHLWDWRRGQKIWKTTRHRGFLSAVAFSHDGRRVVASGSAKTFLRDALSGQLQWSAEGDGDGPNVSGGYPSLFAPRGSLMRASEAVWQLRGGVRAAHLQPSHFSADGRWQARLTPQDQLQVRAFGLLNVWRTLSGSAPRSHYDRVSNAAFSPDAHYVAGSYYAEGVRSGSAGKVDVWELPSGKLRATLTSDLEPARGLVFTPDGESLIIQNGHSVRRWDWTKNSAEAVRWQQNDFFFNVTMGNDTVSSLSMKERDIRNLIVRHWDVATGVDRAKSLVFPRSRLYEYNESGAVLSSDGHWLAVPRVEWRWSLGFRRDALPITWELWQVPERQRVRELPGRSVLGFAPSAGEPRFYAATEGNLLTLREVRTGALILSLFARNNNEYSPVGRHNNRPSPTWFAFTPDGYFDGSLGGIALLRRRVNGQLRPVSDFPAQHRPDILRQRMEALLLP